MYANQLAFLRDVIHRRPTDASMDDMDPSSPNHETGFPSETQASINETPAVHVAKKKGNMVERKLVEALENHNIRQKQKSENVNSGEDDDKLFRLSLLPFLKSIPPHFKFAARMDIMQSINKFVIVQPAAPHHHPQQQYSQNLGASGHQPGIQHWQYLNTQPGPTGVQPYVNQSPSVHQEEPLPGPSGIQQQRAESPLRSPISSLYSQDDTQLTLF